MFEETPSCLDVLQKKRNGGKMGVNINVIKDPRLAYRFLAPQIDKGTYLIIT